MKLLSLFVAALLMLSCVGCQEQPKYGVENPLNWFGQRRVVWAVAPAVNLSGMKEVDPLLQGDLVYQSLQEVNGITAIPVNRVVEVYTTLHLEKVQSEEQAALVCDLLGCDGLLVPTVTAYDPYDPPKLGASLQLFTKDGLERQRNVDVHDLARQATPGPNDSIQRSQTFHQAVGMFDAQNGSVRNALAAYAAGRHDPAGPLAGKEYLVNMDRYSGFVYHELIGQLIQSIGQQ